MDQTSIDAIEQHTALESQHKCPRNAKSLFEFGYFFTRASVGCRTSAQVSALPRIQKLDS